MDSGAEAGRVGSRYGAHLRSRPLADPAVPGIGGRLRRPRQPGAVHRCVRGWAGPHGGRVRRGRAEGDGPAGVCACRPAEALHLRLPEPGALQPAAGGRDLPQHRGDLAAAAPEARLQDHRRLPARQPRRLQAGLPRVRAAVPAARPVRTRVAGSRRSTTRTATSRGPRWPRSSSGPTPSSTTICSASTRATGQRRRPQARG